MVQPRQQYWSAVPFPSPGDLSKKLLCLISSSLHHNRDRSHILKTLMNVGLLSCVLSFKDYHLPLFYLLLENNGLIYFDEFYNSL